MPSGCDAEQYTDRAIDPTADEDDAGTAERRVVQRRLKLDEVNLARKLAERLPQPFVARLNRAQFEHPALGRVLRSATSRVARGEGVIAGGPAAGLRIDATGFHAGYVLGTSDYPEQQWLTETLKPGDVFVDAGAAIGFFSLLASRLVGPQGSVVAFEPFPENAARLRKNAALNDFANVEVNQAAVADAEGTAAFRFAPGRWYGGSLCPPIGSGENIDTISVSVTTLDNFFVGRREPDVIKIDVEGSELDVLMGAMNLLEDARPSLLIEVHWLGERFSDFVEERLAPIGYRAGTLSGEPIPTEPQKFHAVLEVP